MITSVQQLKSWKHGHTLTLLIYTLSAEFPKEERFGITAQLRRASSAIPANIAESFGRYSFREKRHFHCIAKGSVEEVSYFSLLAKELGYLRQENFDCIERLCLELRKILAVAINTLEQKHKQREGSSKTLKPSPNF